MLQVGKFIVGVGMMARKKEVVGSSVGVIGGAIAGAKIGASIEVPFGGISVVVTTPLGVIIGGVLGGLTGNIIGSELDKRTKARNELEFKGFLNSSILIPNWTLKSLVFPSAY